MNQEQVLGRCKENMYEGQRVCVCVCVCKRGVYVLMIIVKLYAHTSKGNVLKCSKSYNMYPC